MQAMYFSFGFVLLRSGSQERQQSVFKLDETSRNGAESDGCTGWLQQDQ